MKKIIVVCGATATGKSALAVQLAKHCNGEIINADSMQVYDQINIASAKPTKAEMEGVPHHLLGICNVTQCFSVATYCALAHEIIDDCCKRNVVPILVGGTGLYIDSVVQNRQFEQAGQNLQLRCELELLYKNEGIDAVAKRLHSLDPNAQVDRCNLRRLIRAIELVTENNAPVQTVLDRRVGEAVYDVLQLGIVVEREQLKERINARVDTMLERGLLHETKQICNVQSTATQAIGIKEMCYYLSGKTTYAESVRLIKRNTRRYAKRQDTWFKRNKNIRWINNLEQAIKLTDNFLIHIKEQEVSQ